MQKIADIKVYKTDNIKKVYKYIYKRYPWEKTEYKIKDQIKHHYEDSTPIYYIVEVNRYWHVLQGGTISDVVKYASGDF